MPKLTLMFDDRELQECGGDQPERAEPAPCVPDAVWRDIDHRQDRVGANQAEGLVRAKDCRRADTKGDGYTVTSMGAKTLVNGQQISGRHDLRRGDLIEVSGLTLEFRLKPATH